jgi:hypothetical protein
MSTMPIFNHGRVLWQSAENDDELPNEAIAIHIDNGGCLIIDQGGNSIVVNRTSLKELCDTLKQVNAAYDKAQSKR